MTLVRSKVNVFEAAYEGEAGFASDCTWGRDDVGNGAGNGMESWVSGLACAEVCGM
jgi:hypothetical protein